jgi:hypothetical protein
MNCWSGHPCYAAEAELLLVTADPGRHDLMQGASLAFAMSEVITGLHGDGDGNPHEAADHSADQRAITLKQYFN